MATLAPAPAPSEGSPLAGHDLCVDLGGFRINGLTLGLERGAVTALVGPNGSGKTTLLRMFGRLLRPDDGAVYVDGQAIDTLWTREIARRIAVLPQSPQAPAGVTVRELVGFGRHPHRGVLGIGGERGRADREAVAWAMDATGLDALADRAVDGLSGGERQRAWIAMALAQQTGVVLLDEPTTYLDVRHQVEVLSLVRRLNREHGLTVGWVLHDLNQAAAYSDTVVMLRDGAIAAQGPPERVMTASMVHDVFGIQVTIVAHPEDGSPLLIPSTGPCRCEACVAVGG